MTFASPLLFIVLAVLVVSLIFLLQAEGSAQYLHEGWKAIQGMLAR
jgi:hypothetical protein